MKAISQPDKKSTAPEFLSRGSIFNFLPANFLQAPVCKLVLIYNIFKNAFYINKNCLIGT